MSKPSDTYAFSTNALSTSDPGSTRRATGFVAGKKLPAKWLNFLLSGAGKWFAYVDNLHNETDFLSKAYAWTAAHTYSGAVSLNGAASVNGTTTVSGAGVLDVDGTLRVSTNVVLDGGANDIVYSAARYVTKYLMPVDCGSWKQGVVLGYARAVFASLPGVIAEYQLDIPDGAVLEYVIAHCKSNTTNAADANRMGLQVVGTTYVAGAANGYTAIGGLVHPGDPGPGFADCASISLGYTKVAGTTVSVRVVASAGASGTNADEIHMIYYAYSYTRASGE
jgi:hypothetical protein